MTPDAIGVDDRERAIAAIRTKAESAVGPVNRMRNEGEGDAPSIEEFLR